MLGHRSASDSRINACQPLALSARLGSRGMYDVESYINSETSAPMHGRRSGCAWLRICIQLVLSCFSWMANMLRSSRQTGDDELLRQLPSLEDERPRSTPLVPREAIVSAAMHSGTPTSTVQTLDGSRTPSPYTRGWGANGRASTVRVALQPRSATVAWGYRPTGWQASTCTPWTVDTRKEQQATALRTDSYPQIEDVEDVELRPEMYVSGAGGRRSQLRAYSVPPANNPRILIRTRPVATRSERSVRWVGGIGQDGREIRITQYARFDSLRYHRAVMARAAASKSESALADQQKGAYAQRPSSSQL